MKNESVSCWVMSDSLWPQGLSPARLFCPWNFPGNSTGVGSHSLSWESIAGRFCTVWATREAEHPKLGCKALSSAIVLEDLTSALYWWKLTLYHLTKEKCFQGPAPVSWSRTKRVNLELRSSMLGFPSWFGGTESACNSGDCHKSQTT